MPARGKGSTMGLGGEPDTAGNDDTVSVKSGYSDSSSSSSGSSSSSSSSSSSPSSASYASAVVDGGGSDDEGDDGAAVAAAAAEPSTPPATSAVTEGTVEDALDNVAAVTAAAAAAAVTAVAAEVGDDEAAADAAAASGAVNRAKALFEQMDAVEQQKQSTPGGRRTSGAGGGASASSGGAGAAGRRKPSASSGTPVGGGAGDRSSLTGSVESESDVSRMGVGMSQCSSSVFAEGRGEYAISGDDRVWLRVAAACDVGTMKRMLDASPALVLRQDYLFGYTALHWASKAGNVDAVKMLLQRSADGGIGAGGMGAGGMGAGVPQQPQVVFVNSRSHGGYTALHLAAVARHADVVCVLLDARADVHLRDNAGMTAYDYATTPELQFLLVASKVDSDAPARGGHAAGVSLAARGRLSSIDEGAPGDGVGKGGTLRGKVANAFSTIRGRKRTGST